MGLPCAQWGPRETDSAIDNDAEGLSFQQGVPSLSSTVEAR